MKIKGAVIPPPEPVTLKFFRAKTVIELRVQAVLSFEQFDRLCPFPKPPLVTKVATGSQSHDFKDRTYIKNVDTYSEHKSDYIIIKGLEATEGLEWDTVKIDEPDTWKNWRKELLSSFTENEVSEIIGGVNEANNPTQKRLTEAFDSFTPPQDQLVMEQEPSSQKEELPVTESGVPAKGSE